MRPSEALNLHRTRTRIREIALSHRVSGVRVFGSALRGVSLATASQIASASAASFLWVLTYGLTNCGAMSLTV